MEPPRYNHPKPVAQAFSLCSLNIDGQPYPVFTVKFYGQAERAISNGQLRELPRFHIRPIDVVVFHGPS